MHRLLALMCLAGIAAATSERPSAFTAASEIKFLLDDIERKMQQFCFKYTSSDLEEMYSVNHYSLRANLTGCYKDGVEVQAGQRIVAVQARDSQCIFLALRLLPEVVDANSAFWRLEDGQITVFFPYESPRPRCGRVVSDDVHSLPQLEIDSEDPDVMVKFGEIGSEKARGRYFQVEDSVKGNLDD